jgi:hypothetical protein
MRRLTGPDRLRGVYVILALLLAVSVPASCSDGSGFEMTVRARDGSDGFPVWCSDDTVLTPIGQPITCQFERAERVWNDGGERKAIQPARTYFLSFLNDPSPALGEYECGGRTLTNVWRTELDPVTTDRSDPLQLVMDDGSSIELSLVGQLDVTGRTLDACQETWGTWHGTAGDLDGRTGTYTTVFDSVQTVLHLVED